MKHTRMNDERVKYSDPEGQKKDYGSITCLPMIWKILTSQKREEINCSFVLIRLFQEEKNDGTG